MLAVVEPSFAPSQLVRSMMPWLALLVVGWIATSETRARSARRRILATPGLAVPAAMAVVALALIHVHLDAVAVFEIPLPFEPGPSSGPAPRDAMVRWSWLGFALVPLTLAGHVGILEASRDGRAPNGFDFVQGVRRHGVTFLLGKLALLVAVFVLLNNVSTRGPAILLLLLPSVLLAPLPGIATLHPGRPLVALVATVRHALQNLQTVGYRVTLLTGFLLAAQYAAGRIADVTANTRLLAGSVSTLSWNAYPWLQWAGRDAALLILVAGAAFVSAVMVTAQWLAVVEPRDEPVRDPRTSAAA